MATMIGSRRGHSTASPSAKVAPAIHQSVAGAVLAFDLAATSPTQSQPPATAAPAIHVIQAWMLPNHAIVAPALVRAIAGMASGSTQHTPQATAAVAAVAAMALAVFPSFFEAVATISTLHSRKRIERQSHRRGQAARPLALLGQQGP